MRRKKKETETKGQPTRNRFVFRLFFVLGQNAEIGVEKEKEKTRNEKGKKKKFKRHR